MPRSQLRSAHLAFNRSRLFQAASVEVNLVQPSRLRVLYQDFGNMQHHTVCVISCITFLSVFAIVCAESSDSHSPLDSAALRLANEDSGKRGWNELSGVWGKRDWNNLQGMWGKRGWNNLQNMWGKRGWNNLQNMWGKRGWNNLQGMWGKRDTDTPEVVYVPSDKKSGWTKLTGMWGKRSNYGWRREPSSWDRYSIEEEDPEIVKEMMS